MRLLVLTVAIVTAAALAQPASAQTRQDESIDYREWSSAPGFAGGRAEGVSADAEGLRITRPVGTVERADPGADTATTYEYGRWTSPPHRHDFGATELVASWNAGTPAGTWLQVEARGVTDAGENTRWYVLGQWAYGDGDIHRTTVDGQSDEHARVVVDTLATEPGVTLTAYQLRVTLYREQGIDATPTVRMIGAMTSHVPGRFEVPMSPPGKASGVELDVPPHAQNLHTGHYPEFGGGGESWCSPTSTQMVVEYWGKGPTRDELSWLPDGYVDPAVAHAARHTYDYAYEGTGNWPFNTAYAAHFGLRAHVTRLHSLAELEDYIVRGIPVVTSQSFLASELDGAGYGTAGHLMVVVGFTEDGDVIANDPAADSNAAVRNVYPREQFEQIWQRTKRHDANGRVASGTGGVAYIITPDR